MQYMGGKVRLSRAIRDVILTSVPNAAQRGYFEPFLGGGSTFAALAPHFKTAHGSDAHEDLMLMWGAVRGGWVPPTEVSEDEYQNLKAAEPSALRGFVGFGCSYAGKWFGGYARERDRNYARQSSNLVMKKSPAFRAPHVVLAHHGYLDIDVVLQPGDVVYCDPPYSGKTGYKGTPKFDHEEFWNTARTWRELGVLVFVSEFQAPDDWTSIWTRGNPGSYTSSLRCSVK